MCCIPTILRRILPGLALCLLLVPGSASREGENLVADGSFEEPKQVRLSDLEIDLSNNR